MSREWRLYLEDILECDRRVRRYTSGMDQTAFASNDMVHDAVLRNLEIVGEASRKVPENIRQQMTGIEWKEIFGMRNWLAHGYFHVNEDIIWNVIENKLPELAQVVQRFLDDHPATTASSPSE
jgi:uncharacterized protein with HEPN domain